MKNYWLIVETNEDAKLKDLDKLIRNVWVECCGHLSMFGDYGSEIGMSRKIIGFLEPGDSIPYTYDFGSSTELVVKVLDYSPYDLTDKKNIELVARNYPPDFRCQVCGKTALKVCPYCVEEEPAYFCQNCAESHEESGDDCCLMDISNSPRSGVCGYETSDPIDKLFI